MAGPDDPDYELRIAADGQATYTLTFGSLLRGGAVYESPPLDSETDGRITGGTTTATDGDVDVWRADGPINLRNEGAGNLGVKVNGSPPYRIQPTGSLDSSCPTERKRIVGLAAVGGAALGSLSGVLGGLRG